MRIPFDIYGSRERSIAVITDYNISKKKAKEYAKEILSRYKHVKSVLWRRGKRGGKFRLYNQSYLAGSKKTTVIHKEYGYKIKIDPTKVFFSPREGEERQRVANLVKNKEKILLLFAGVGPYAIAIGKKKDVEIVCVEWNPVAVRLAKQNMKLNKIKNVKIKKMDAKYCPKLGKFDRIIMPLGTTAIKYLKYALKCAHKGTIIHLYVKTENKAKDIIKKIPYKILRTQKVANYSPGVEKYRIDILVNTI